MAKYLDAIRTTARQLLRDEIAEDETPDFADDELDQHINKCLIEISEQNSRIVREIVYATNKSGTATATTASHLVDATNAQFVAGDVGKTVYNATDETTAKITAYTSASDVTLDTDIMASGESYYIYDTDCISAKELDISDIEDWIEIEKAEYPTRQDPQDFRDVSVSGNIVRLNVDATPDDGDEIFLYCRKVHSLTESTSTLKPNLEKVLVEGVVAKVAQAWCAEQKRKDIVPASVEGHQRWADRQDDAYRYNLHLITAQRVWEYYSPG